MDAHALELLEFHAVREEVAGLTLGSGGERAVLEAPILSNRDRIDALLDLVADWRAVLSHEGRTPDAPFPDIASIFEGIKKEGTVADQEQLAAVALFIGASRSLVRSGQDLQTTQPLKRRLAELPDLSTVRREIAGYISDSGEIKDDAVPELRRLRERIRGTESRIEKKALAYVRDPQRSRIWTSDTPTQRNGRTVLPLSADYRGRVPGIVHEVSQTGATLFVEPNDLVELNNELREVQAAYDQEIHRILRELTSSLRAYLSELRTLEAEVSELDAALARARYADRHGCFRAHSSDAGLELTGARHPLIRRGVVPIDVSIRPSQRGLIITGPNTGGKTVALKTVGLLAAMNQFGMEIPADEGSSLPIFETIFADIGDEQSLEQSLSTFSSHMTTIGRVLQQATERSLVLFDELGAGTDPEEGSALAMAILDALARIGCTALVTTHHGALKNYAYRSNVFENASVEFDPEKLEPTYHLLTGVPGTSHAVEIAARNGLPEEVVAEAESYVQEGQGDEARIIEDLTEKQVEAYRTVRAREKELEEVRRRREQLEEQERRVADRELALRKEGLKEFERLSRDTRSRLENLVRELREGELTKEKTAKVRAFLDEISGTVEEEQERISEAEAQRERARRHREQREIEPGMEVSVGGSGRVGIVRRKGKGDAWIVETENMRAELPAGRLTPVEPAHSRAGTGDAGRDQRHTGEGKRSSEVGVSYDRGGGSTPSLELDLRGYRLPEAVSAVDRQIDDCLLSGIGRFSVIHGKGQGILQKGIRDHLAEHDGVSQYEFARPEEGGYGKTVVHVRDG